MNTINWFFTQITLDKSLLVPPKYFGPNLRSHIHMKLHSEVEGKCTERHGFVILVTGIEKIGNGRVQEGTGWVSFDIKYKAIVFRPFKGEILDAIVTQVTKVGFFAEAGPLQIFVSSHQIPNWKFDLESANPSFVSEDNTLRLERDKEVRIRILGTNATGTEFNAVGEFLQLFV